MRLATFEQNGTARWGLVLRHPRDGADWIFDPAGVLATTRKLPALKGSGYTWWRPEFIPSGGAWPHSLAALLALGAPALDAVRRMHDFLLRYLEQGDPFMLDGAGWPVTAIRLRAPIPKPRLLLGVVGNNAGFLRMDPIRGRNLHQPSCHQRTQTSIVGPGEAIVLPAGGEAFAGTTELGIVIGRGGREIPRERAREHVAGFTVVNDGLGSLYARRWAELDRGVGANDPHFHAANSASWLDKKSDAMLAMGPWLVTPDEVGDPYDLLCWYRESGLVRNRAHSGAMACSIEETIHWLSGFLTLEPGMVIHFGAMGQDGLSAAPVNARSADHWVECEIERVGVLRNPLCVECDTLGARASPPASATEAGGTPALPWQPSHTHHFWTLLANTRAAAGRTAIAPRSYPLAYNNPPTALAASGAEVTLPARARTLTATCELGVVIGRVMKNVRPGDVLAHLLGGVAILALRDSSFTDCLVQPHALPGNMPEIYARWPDGFNVVSDAAPLPGTLAGCALRIEVGAAHATATGADYLLDAAAAVSELSRGITLQPGDVVSLGETAASLTVPRAGGLVRARIDGIGEAVAALPSR